MKKDEIEPIGSLLEHEMPLYQSHKKVRGLKISSVIRDAVFAKNENREADGSAVIVPVNKSYPPFKVSEDYVDKHSPKAGGYYVVYKGGYASWSPADAFEEGNTLIVE